MAIEQLNIESFVNRSIDLDSAPIQTLDLSSHIKYNVVLESYYNNILSFESRIYLEEI